MTDKETPDFENKNGSHRTLEITVQPLRIIDVGWMAADEYNGPDHQAYLEAQCAGEHCIYPDEIEELPIFYEFPNTTTSMHLGMNDGWKGNKSWHWFPVHIAVKIDGKTVFNCSATPEDGGCIRFVEKAPPFLSPSDTDASRWLVGATILKGTVWSPWEMEVPADFRFDPAKLEIPFFRIPIEDGEEPVAIARHSDISYDGKGPKLKDGDFEPVDGDYVQTVRTSFTLSDLKAFASSLGRRGKVCKN
jgi:hypothetical protein